MDSKFGEFIWKDGEYVKWEDAQIHIMSHVVHYGSSVFEGIRSYSTQNGPAVFRLKDHIQRLHDSAKIYRMELKWTVDELCTACIETIRKNELGACYVRPVVFRGFGTFGVNPLQNPLLTYIATWEWGAYLGPEALEQGVEVCVSSWNRMAPNTLPALAKAGANYMNSQLIKMEAVINGFSEGIALDDNGYVSEGSGENIFVIRNNEIITPPLSSSILPGLTRDTVLRICSDLGIKVTQSMIPREMLYIADEVFFTGTAAEITPIRSIDKIQIGAGKRGPVTEKIQKEFFKIFTGERTVPKDWLTPI
jgi:branched-chain amino acid aminotransferase